MTTSGHTEPRSVSATSAVTAPTSTARVSVTRSAGPNRSIPYRGMASARTAQPATQNVTAASQPERPSPANLLSRASTATSAAVATVSVRAVGT
jgi:hypothetical protein